MNDNTARIVLLLVLCASGLGSAQTATKEALQYPSPVDVYEAVLRYQIKTWELAANSYCVKVNGKDAQAALLERFRPLPVKGASACRKQTSQSVLMRVIDGGTGKQSVIFDMGEIRWPKQSEAEVDGGYLCGSLCMAGGTYHVAWDEGRWVVTKFSVRVQS
jgi:hypothetical protein